MHKMNGFAAALMVAFAGFSSLPAMAAPEAPVVIRFSHVVKAETPKGRAADKFKELAEKYTGNKVKVEVYPNSTLHNDDAEMKAVINGDVEIIAPSLSKMGGLGVKEFQALDAPYLFETSEDVAYILDGPIGQSLLKKLEDKDIYGMAFWDNGFKQMHSNKPLRAPGDAKGLKMRIQPSKVLSAQMKLMGAIPKPMSFGELSAGLQHGLIDGSENPTSNFYTQNLQNFQKYMTMTNHGYLGYIVVSNKNWWEGLSKEIRPQIEKAMREATEFERSITTEANDIALVNIKETGKTRIVNLTPSERSLWVSTIEPATNQLDDSSKKVVLDIKSALKAKKEGKK